MVMSRQGYQLSLSWVAGGGRAGAPASLIGSSLKVSLGVRRYPGIFGRRTLAQPGMTECSHGPTGLPRDHPESYHSFMWNNFFKHIDIHPENTHILDGNAADLQAECDALKRRSRLRAGLSCLLEVSSTLQQVSRVAGTHEKEDKTHACLPNSFLSMPVAGVICSPEVAGKAQSGSPCCSETDLGHLLFFSVLSKVRYLDLDSDSLRFLDRVLWISHGNWLIS